MKCRRSVSWKNRYMHLEGLIEDYIKNAKDFDKKDEVMTLESLLRGSKLLRGIKEE
jgi:hypothetical protein